MAKGEAGSGPFSADLYEAHRRIAELEAKLSQRELVIRGLRRRLQEIEEPYWERRGKLEVELSDLRHRLRELDELSQSPPSQQLEDELRALRATRTFRYSASARAVYARFRQMQRPST